MRSLAPSCGRAGSGGFSGTCRPSVPETGTSLPDHLVEVFGEATPLWFYILKEAEIFRSGRSLGPVGGRIVSEVLLGLLAGGPFSFLNVRPTWRPKRGEFGAPKDGVFGVADLLRFAGVRIE